jgi:hypothetical protein
METFTAGALERTNQIRAGVRTISVVYRAFVNIVAVGFVV